MLNIKKLNRAIACAKNKDFKTAELIYAELLREYPDNGMLLSFWGMYNVKTGKYTKAEKILERAYKIKKSPSTIASLALTKFKIQKYDDAIILYEELFKYDKDGINIYQKIIECFDKLEMYNFAEAYCEKFILAHPESYIALNTITSIYMHMGNYKKAEEFCAISIDKFPENDYNWINAGLLQELLYCNEEMAQECYKTAIEHNNPQGYYHLAVSLTKIGKKKEAEDCYKKYFSSYPKERNLRASLGMLYLSEKRFEEGYKNYMCRDKTHERLTLKKLWSGDFSESYAEDQTVLVYSDQGLGDGIMFSRYLPYLKDKFENVIVYVRESNFELLKNSFPGINFIYENLSDAQYDFSLLLADIPYFLQMNFDNIPSLNLKVNQKKFEIYKEKYFNTQKLKVGLCWKAGDMSIRAAINRTVNIDYFKDILGIDKIQYYSFQKEDIFDAVEKYPQIIDLSDSIHNFDDTAAALKNLDLMICADTSVVHVAGGIGLKTKLLLPYSSDWRWFENTERTEWYSSVEILKQKDRQDWFIEVDKIKQDLLLYLDKV